MVTIDGEELLRGGGVVTGFTTVSVIDDKDEGGGFVSIATCSWTCPSCLADISNGCCAVFSGTGSASLRGEDGGIED